MKGKIIKFFQCHFWISSCGFGALVLILLISQFKTYDSNNTDASEKILETLQTIDLLELEIENLKNSNNNLSNFVNELNTKLSAKESLLNSVMVPPQQPMQVIKVKLLV